VLLRHGIQVQLLAYLAALRAVVSPGWAAGVRQLVPAGGFYVNLRGAYAAAAHRGEALAAAAEARRLAYRHTGRFNAAALDQLDRRPDAVAGDQFNYRRKADGSLHARCVEALSPDAWDGQMDMVAGQLQAAGKRIFEGDAAVDPYQHAGQTPCEQCPVRPVCRIDPWTHRYRRLRSAAAAADPP
jgi:ATP-dependent helicase/DNAse subunit B